MDYYDYVNGANQGYDSYGNGMNQDYDSYGNGMNQGYDSYGNGMNQGYDSYGNGMNSGYDQNQNFNQNIYGAQMYDGRRFTGYTPSQIKQFLMQYVMNMYQKPIRREVNMTDYPMPDDDSDALYGNMRHACATRGVCFLAPKVFYIPEMDLNIVYYYCEDCNTLYYSKAHTTEDARERREVLRYNNSLIRQQEREMIANQKAYMRDVQRYYKEMERAQNRAWKEQIRMYNRSMRCS